MKTKLHSFLIVLMFLVGVHSAAAQGTAFTYQGRLSNTNGAASGTYDLTFKLYNASSGGSQVGSTFTASSTVISNGLFTTTIDFGGVFNGSSYWLDLGVRTNGAASFTTLTPRQPLTPTPYAITAENVDGLVSASQLSGTIPPSALAGTYGNGLTLNNAGNILNGNGAGLTGLNASQLTTGTVPDARLNPDVALLNRANQTFTGLNTFSDMLDITDVGGNTTTPYDDLNIIALGGYNGGEEHNINFNDGGGHIGSLIVGYNGVGYFSVGNLYYNGTHPTGTKAFSVFGNGTVTIDPASLNAGFLNNGSTNGSGLTFGSASGEGIASQRTAGVDLYSLEFYTAFVNRMTILNNGFVGINTTNPTAQLHIIKGVGTGAGDSYGGGPAILADISSGDGIYINETDSDGFAVWANATSGIGVYATATSGTGVEATSSTGTAVYASSSSGSALTIASGAIHVSGASTNSTSTAAFTQVATVANIAGDFTTINNTLCNGDPNAILIVTPNWNPRGGPSFYWNHVVGVFYSAPNWRIFNEDLATMPAGPAFNVLIIKN